MDDDNPGLSLFKGIENIEAQEEEEELEDIRRRQEELQNLIAANLDDYNFDDSSLSSTINTANTSLDDENSNGSSGERAPTHSSSEEAFEHEQMKLLYQVRTTELQSLQEEFDKCKAENEQERTLLQTKCNLFESELQHARISLQQSQELLVSKTKTLKENQTAMQKADERINELENAVKKLEFDNNSFKCINEDLNNKVIVMQSEISSAANKIEERQVHTHYLQQVQSLEHKLEDATKTIETLENQKSQLQNDLQIVKREKDDVVYEKSKMINYLTDSLDTLQRQACDSTELIQKVKSECAKYKEELDNLKEIFTKLTQSHAISKIQDIDLFICGLKNELLQKETRIQNLVKELEERDKRKTETADKSSETDSDDYVAFEQGVQTDSLIEMQSSPFASITDLLETKPMKASIAKTLETSRNEYHAMTEKYIETIKVTYATIKSLKKQNENIKKDNDKLRDALQKKAALSGKLELERARADDLQQRLNAAHQHLQSTQSVEALKALDCLELETISKELQLREELKREFEKKVANVERRYADFKKTECTKHSAKIQHYKAVLSKLRVEITNFGECAASHVKGLERKLTEVGEERGQVIRQLKTLERVLNEKDEKLVVMRNALKQTHKVVEAMKGSLFVSLSATTDFIQKTKHLDKEVEEMLKGTKK